MKIIIKASEIELEISEKEKVKIATVSRKTGGLSVILIEITSTYKKCKHRINAHKEFKKIRKAYNKVEKRPCCKSQKKNQ